MFFLAEAFGLVFSLPVSSKSKSFRHFPSPERRSTKLRLQRHLPPGFEGALYDRSGWCFVEARVFVLHHISRQLHNDTHVGATPRWDWAVACACVRFCCYRQASISSVIKPGNSRYDLGLVEIGDLSNIHVNWGSLRSGRMPPLSPARVAQKLKDEKEFTNQSDVKRVVNLYTSFFRTVSSSIQELT